jgi:general stress protein 26
MNHARRDEAISTLAEMIGQIRIAMLTTVPDDGGLRSRPITTHGARFDGDLWFLTHVGSAKVEELHRDRRVGLTYVRLADNVYISLSGTAHVVIDPRKAAELWEASYASWFPGGPDDPELALIRVRVEHAEYWAAPALTWPLSAGFVVMAPEHREDPRLHARIVLDRPDRGVA